MSFFKRGLNIIKGKISLLQNADSASDRRKLRELDLEMDSNRRKESSPKTPAKKPSGSDDIPSDVSSDSDALPSTKKRTI